MTLIQELDLHILKIKFMGQDFEKLEHKQDRHRDRCDQMRKQRSMDGKNDKEFSSPVGNR